MKQIRIIAFLSACLVAFSVSIAYGQDDMMRLEMEGSRERVPVDFNHESHSELIECGRCHHDFDEFGVNTDDEGKSCDTCHAMTPGDNPVDLLKAFHMMCKGCHEDLIRKGSYNPPRTCGSCHERAKITASHNAMTGGDQVDKP